MHLCTRIIRLKNEQLSEPRRLSGDDPNRKIVFVSNADASAKLLGKNGFECLLQIGYPERWIREDLLPPGPNQRKFEMVAFPEASCRSAKWKDFLEVVAVAYPDVKRDCERFLNQLVTLAAESRDRGWGYFNELLGFDIAKQAKEKGSKNFMSLEHYLESARTVAHFRAFLAHTCYANELFSGDGFTYNDAGERQAEEFVMADAAIDNIEGSSFCEMQVVAPTTSTSTPA